MNALLTWLHTFSAPCVMVGGSLGLMVYSLCRPRFLHLSLMIVGCIALVAQGYALTSSDLSSLSPVLAHDLITHPWIQSIQTLLLGGWVLYTLTGCVSDHQSLNSMTPDVWLLLMLSITGMLWSLHAQSFLTLFLCLEMMSLPLYITTGALRTWSLSSGAALKYFILGSLGSACFLFGSSLIYGTTVSLDLGVWLNYAPSLDACCCDSQPLFWVGTMLVMAGLLFKMSIVPFHLWTPDIYGGVPLMLTSFYSIFPKVGMVGVLTRLCTEMSLYTRGTIQPLLLLLGGGSIIVGALGTLGQTHLGRLLGYSSILNSGFLVWGAALSGGSMPVLVFVMGYGLSLLGLLAMLKFLNFPLTFDDCQGLWHKHPGHAVAFTVFIGSWIGLPPLAGFWGKFQILGLLLNHHHEVWAIIGVIGSVLAGAYGLRFIQALWFASPAEHLRQGLSISRSWPFESILAILTLITLGFGLILAWCQPWMLAAIKV